LIFQSGATSGAGWQVIANGSGGFASGAIMNVGNNGITTFNGTTSTNNINSAGALTFTNTSTNPIINTAQTIGIQMDTFGNLSFKTAANSGSTWSVNANGSGGVGAGFVLQVGNNGVVTISGPLTVNGNPSTFGNVSVSGTLACNNGVTCITFPNSGAIFFDAFGNANFNAGAGSRSFWQINANGSGGYPAGAIFSVGNNGVITIPGSLSINAVQSNRILCTANGGPTSPTITTITSTGPSPPTNASNTITVGIGTFQVNWNQTGQVPSATSCAIAFVTTGGSVFGETTGYCELSVSNFATTQASMIFIITTGTGSISFSATGFSSLTNGLITVLQLV
jgi:hypothetical protein